MVHGWLDPSLRRRQPDGGYSAVSADLPPAASSPDFSPSAGEGDPVAPAGPDLVQLDDVAERIGDEDLVRVLSHETADRPVLHPPFLELAPRLVDVLDGERDMGPGRVFLRVARDRDSPVAPMRWI